MLGIYTSPQPIIGSPWYVYVQSDFYCRPFYVGKGKGRRYLHNHDHNKEYVGIVMMNGRENIKNMFLYVNNENDSIRLEIKMIAYLKALGCKLVNKTLGGDGLSGYKHKQETINKMIGKATGRKHKPETIEKMSIAKKGKCPYKRTDETNNKNRMARIGKKHSEETKNKISLKKLSNPTIPWNKGIKLSDDHKRKLSEAHIGVPLSEEHKKKLSESGMGREVKPETREKISKSNKGHKLTPEQVAKMVASKIGKPPSNKGKKLTPLERTKMRLVRMVNKSSKLLEMGILIKPETLVEKYKNA